MYTDFDDDDDYEADEREHQEGVRRAAQRTAPRKALAGIEVLPEYTFILESVKARKPAIFVTGKAGTGKSTFIGYIMSQVARSVVVAPTAIAALNVGGVTIHSFFGIPPRTLNSDEIAKPKPELINVIKNLDVLIVDEVSMVTPDIVDCINNTLRAIGKKDQPFGGVPVVFVGDLLQLPPVIGRDVGTYYSQHYNTPNFYSAQVFQQVDIIPVELTKVFRQTDLEFIKALDCIRVGEGHQHVLSLFNARCGLPAGPAALNLVATNAAAQEVNDRELSKIDKPLKSYKSSSVGNFDTGASRLPAPEQLNLKVGSHVIFLKNEKDRAWVNGTLGQVVELRDTVIMVRILSTGDQVAVGRETWEKLQYRYDSKKKRIEAQKIGTFTQFPLALGWAVTIHKSQGMTLDAAHIDMGRGAFCTGQTYVALSRCRTLEGLTFNQRLTMADIKVDGRVVDFYRQLRAAAASVEAGGPDSGLSMQQQMELEMGGSGGR